ncbi:hypothetical protein SAMN05444920_14321 [Nonomuraea solani]|uniref:DUF4097 domain-containing protein n=1 Tax=Nonomuraea solani TaxID=1144553 RepID=A0A1H6F121_9ACTN|nr:DUF4097 family beta strand repeat-containing protein [Nonomuraea solani]SEH03752.1 hypothetical protein SAMN05444920_14321 [Nonomuraea solani]
MRAAWLTAGTVVTVFALLLSSVLIWRGVARARTPEETTARSIPFGERQLRIKAGQGDVNVIILPGQAGKLVIQRSLRWSSDRPTVTEDWDDKTRTLRLEAVCNHSDQPDGPICQADYLLLVPPETDIEAGMNDGDLTLNSIFGDARIDSVAGDVYVNDLTGRLWARIGTGNVDATELDTKEADVEVGGGDLDLSFTNAPTTVKAVVRTMGDVRVHVPGGFYDVTVDALNSTVDLGRRAGAERRITARAPSGVVFLCCR